MKLQTFLRGVTSHMFQPAVAVSAIFAGAKRPIEYGDCFFHLTRLVCTDGYSISAQINHGNYAESEVGYREFGYFWEYLEIGGIVDGDAEIDAYVAGDGVSRIHVETLEDILYRNHGGIDWERTLSFRACARLMHEKMPEYVKIYD